MDVANVLSSIEGSTDLIFFNFFVECINQKGRLDKKMHIVD